MTPAAVMTALALLCGGASAGDGAPPKKPVATLEHATLRAAGKVLTGWPLDPDATEGFAFLGDDGAIVVVAREPAPELSDVVMGPVTDVPSAALVAGLEHAEAGVRDRCKGLLLDQGDVALPFLGTALVSDSAEARRRALEILVKQPTRRWLARVREALTDREERVRKTALAAYAALKPDDLVSCCADLLQSDRSSLVRHEAIVRLGRTGDLHAVDPLLEHLVGCEERGLRLVTFDALRRLTGKSFDSNEESWRSYWTNHREELLAPKGH